MAFIEYITVYKSDDDSVRFLSVISLLNRTIEVRWRYAPLTTIVLEGAVWNLYDSYWDNRLPLSLAVFYVQKWRSNKSGKFLFTIGVGFTAVKSQIDKNGIFIFLYFYRVLIGRTETCLTWIPLDVLITLEPKFFKIEQKWSSHGQICPTPLNLAIIF